MVTKSFDEIKLSELAAKTDDTQKLNEFFELGNPKILRALSINKNTPEKLLKKLSELKGIKFSNEIRNNANKRLQKLNKINNVEL